MDNIALWSNELCDVTEFQIVDRYVLDVFFSDGSSRVIDFGSILYGPLFGPLRDVTLFNQVRIDSDLGTLVWPTGADIDPNVLHDWPDHVDAIVERRRKQYAGLMDRHEHVVAA